MNKFALGIDVPVLVQVAAGEAETAAAAGTLESPGDGLGTAGV